MGFDIFGVLGFVGLVVQLPSSLRSQLRNPERTELQIMATKIKNLKAVGVSLYSNRGGRGGGMGDRLVPSFVRWSVDRFVIQKYMWDTFGFWVLHGVNTFRWLGIGFLCAQF